MDHTIIVALISSSGSVLIGMTALLLNYRGFGSLEARITTLENRVDSRIGSFETRVDARFNLMQSDMRDLNKAMTALDVDVALLKDKAGL